MEIQPMKMTLKKIVQIFCAKDRTLSTFKYFLKRSLKNTGMQDFELVEGGAIEIQDGFVTICFSWDMISAVNNITHKYCDLINPENAFDVFD